MVRVGCPQERDSLEMASFNLNHDSQRSDGNNEADSEEAMFIMGEDADDEVSMLIERSQPVCQQVEVQRKIAEPKTRRN